jgi:hypothetical protein
MNALSLFHSAKGSLLNAPAEKSALQRFRTRLDDQGADLVQMYRQFDGEKFWGALLPGFRICSLADVDELIEATADSWEWLEETRGTTHVMRMFVPFMSSTRKTNIGPILDVRSELSGHVVEYDYEAGELVVWAKSVDQFLEAFFTLSTQHIALPRSLNDALTAESYRFSSRDVAMLSKWRDIVYPVFNAPARDVAEI